MQDNQNKMFISRRKAITGLLAVGAGLSINLASTPASFAATLSPFDTNPTPQKFKATIKTSHVALKHQKATKKTSKIALKTYQLKTNSQAKPLAVADLKATFSAYPVNTSSDPGLGSIITGDDGSSFWFAEEGANRIGKITTQGAITEYLLPLSGYESYGIANGPGDTFWFTYSGGSTSYIGRMIGASGQVTLYQLPISTNESARVTRGPNDTLWFVSGSNTVGSVTTDGALTLYTVSGIIRTFSIATGSDGALWFTYDGDPANSDPANGVARITTDGSVTLYPVSNASIYDIKTGRANDLWFPVFEDVNGPDVRYIGRITVDGTLTTYDVTSLLKGNAYPIAVAHLGNGTFAFGTGQEGGKGNNYQYVGTITPSGDVQAFQTPNADQVISMVYAGWANEVWLTSADKNNSNKYKIYKFRVTN